MPTYKQVVNHVKKHVLWKDEYFERYYRLNPELVQKRLDKIYQAEDDLMVLISTQLFCFLRQHRPKQYRVDPSFQTSGGRSHQFVSARQYKAACNEADEFSARVICEGSRFRLLS